MTPRAPAGNIAWARAEWGSSATASAPPVFLPAITDKAAKLVPFVSGPETQHDSIQMDSVSRREGRRAGRVVANGMKRSKKIKQLDQCEMRACIERLEHLIAGLKAGSIGIEDNGETVLLNPGGLVDFELRVDRLQRRETLRVEMTWRPEATSTEHSDSAAPADRANGHSTAPPASVGPARAEAGAPEGEAPPSMPPLDPLAPADVQGWFMAARVLGSDGRWHLDQDRLFVSLESAGIDALTQQELYAFALQADADGRTSLLSERVMEAIRRVGEPARGNDGAPVAPNGAH
jgi:amphi-Trp domain-containing protein